MRPIYEVFFTERLQGSHFFVTDLSFHPLHLHKELELCGVLRGEGRFSGPALQTDARPGDIVLIDANTPHEIAGTGGPVLLMVLLLAKSNASDVFPQINTARFPTCRLTDCLPAPALASLWKKLTDLFLEYYRQPFGYELTCTAAIRFILHFLLNMVPGAAVEGDGQVPDARRPELRLARILQYLDEHFSSRLSLTELADAEGLTPTYLSHFFKKYVGVSFQTYLNQLRFEKALQLYPATGLSLTDICLESGFADTRYFSREFTRRFGHSLHRHPDRRTESVSNAQMPKAYIQKVYDADVSQQQILRYAPPFCRCTPTEYASARPR